ncbi:MAG: hypothetical protein A8274_1369 [Halanaerobium sp. 4-GBenrich]|jgi:hypothetical protein|uniref:Uncharacterized protein n=1 Tax=Halanaerobium congolense TaxID=54121 RepID=A0A1G6PJH7_9FIRM|nr:hypothetical protein [Halanaerobium congolense]KXS50551.1 MAG: hypothetical protein AWL62_43 [Halanaerobium sp. T82-1]ODS49672.1 MAG: hypothetical protein A8274_1369 [Halanaerobium sp. 4-GBenrich]PUU92729.1 MAG: hypothetical protein CI948_502 [Halanaerobium sp.]PTX16802.1 hypothetical protein C7953_1535 [Halanaerobium congolense]PXV66391.1 hypothetical protein C8C78_11128 [Halanaerobium congolense]
MVDQIYYKVQYPLKKAIDVMKELDDLDLNILKKDLNNYDQKKINNFLNSWNNGGRDKIISLINDLRSQQ